MQVDFTKQIKQETSKLVDINSVLMKLNDKGYIQQIGDLFENIFQEEQAYTVQELSRLMNNLSKDRYFDMNMQFKMNTSIFKTNFDVIVGVIINNLWSKITDEYLANIDEQQKDTPYAKQSQQQQQNIQQQEQAQEISQNLQNIQQQQEQQQQQQPQQQQSQSQPQSLKTSLQGKQMQNLQKQQQVQQQAQINKRTSQGNNYQYQNTSLVNTSQQVQSNPNNESWVLKTIKSGNRNNSNVNKSAVDLYEGRRSQVLQRNTNISFSQISNKKKQQNLQNTSKISISSVRSVGSLSKIGGPVPFSEISGIHDQSQFRSNSPNLNSSFSRAPRDLDKSNYEQSPGPDHYDVNRSMHQVRKSSPNTKFGKSERISWIDEKLRYDSSVQTPGAKYDPVKIGTSKKNPRLSKK